MPHASTSGTMEKTQDWMKLMNEFEMPEQEETAVVVPEPAPEMVEPGTFGQRLIFFVVTAVILLLDQGSKYWIEATLRLGEVWAPIPAMEPFFRIFHVSNTGAAFGLLPAGGNVFALLAVVVGAILIYYNHSLPKGQLGFRVVLGLLLGGAWGNMIDRVRLGHVTDFLDFGPWPVFNVADMSIVAGVIVMGWFTYQEYRHEQALKLEAERATADHDTEAKTSDEWSTSLPDA